MDAPYFAMGMTMELDDVGNGERQESKDVRESWNQRSHQAPSCQPRHQERVEPSGGHCQRMSSSSAISGSTRSSKVGTLLATGRVSSFPSSGDSYLRTAPIMNESFFQMPPDRFRGSIPAVSGLDTREVTVPNVAIQDEYAVENIRIMFPNLSRQQSEQGSSCSSDSGSSDGIESTERPANSKKSHHSSTRGFPNADVMAEGLDMTLPFPVKLHYIVSNPRFKEYIDWCPHGRAWRVLNQQAFEREVIPLFFRSDKITSFMRQVNGWAFVRISQGPDVNCYYHEMFLRGIPRLAFHMKRPPKVKNAASMARKQTGACVGGSPDFYRISQIAPLPPVMPYKIAIEAAKKSGDDTTSDVTLAAHFATRYVIEPLPVDVIKADLDRPMSPEEPRQEIIEPRSFADAFNERGSDKFEKVVDAASGIEENVMYSSTRSSSTGKSSLDLSPFGMQGLSAADISYLAHQNRTLRKHF